MFQEILKGAAGILVLMGVWFLVQAFLRRRNSLPEGQDVLEPMAEGCGNCGEHGNCQRKELHSCR